jgi:hypothetical protein
MPITVERPSTNPDNLNAMDSRQRNDGDIDLPSDALETMRPSSEKAATLQAENQQKLEDTDTPEYPGGFTLGMITLGLMLMVFCIGLVSQFKRLTTLPLSISHEIYALT